MMRLLFILFLVLAAGFLLLQGIGFRSKEKNPVFMRADEIAGKHQTKIEVSIHSVYKPDSVQLEKLKQDYGNTWAHLNHLYATNDIEAGKEYYTEDWFRQLAMHYQKRQEAVITRLDKQHELQVENWAWDGLVCSAIDKDVIFEYTYPDKSIRQTRAKIAVVLLIQGDHWRIDALRVIHEVPL